MIKPNFVQRSQSRPERRSLAMSQILW